MADVNFLPLADYSGDRSFNSINVPNNIDRVQIKIARCTTVTPTIWPNVSTELRLLAEVSYDNGNTWEILVGLKDTGGVIIGKNGSEATHTFAEGKFLSRTGRRVRGNMTITNGPCRTSMDLVIT